MAINKSNKSYLFDEISSESKDSVEKIISHVEKAFGRPGVELRNQMK